MSGCGLQSVSRRELLRQAGAGFGLLGLAGTLASAGLLTAAEASSWAKRGHFPAKARRVIFLFLFWSSFCLSCSSWLSVVGEAFQPYSLNQTALLLSPFLTMTLCSSSTRRKFNLLGAGGSAGLLAPTPGRSDLGLRGWWLLLPGVRVSVRGAR